MAKSTSRYLLAMRAFVELIRYDVVNSTFGFERIHAKLSRQKVQPKQAINDAAAMIPEAVSLAACFYWKPILCLQRSAVATRMLKKQGVDAHMVIGYRPSPFFSHAWVEVDGRVVNDSPAYKERLQVLCTI